MESWPRDFWQLGKFLLHQQCWCWGRDVRCPAGNLLVGYGFERQRPERPEMGSSRYVLARPEEPELYLWAFGMLVRQPGEAGIYIGRYCFVPGWVPDGMPLNRAWRGEMFALQKPPDTRHQIRVSRQLLRWTLRQLADYEEWVLRDQGVGWRRESLRDWHEPAILPDRMGDEWRHLSWHIPEPPVVLAKQRQALLAPQAVLTGEVRGG